MRSDCNHSSIATSALNRPAAPQKAFAPSVRLFSRKELLRLSEEIDADILHLGPRTSMHSLGKQRCGLVLT